MAPKPSELPTMIPMMLENTVVGHGRVDFLDPVREDATEEFEPPPQSVSPDISLEQSLHGSRYLLPGLLQNMKSDALDSSPEDVSLRASTYLLPLGEEELELSVALDKSLPSVTTWLTLQTQEETLGEWGGDDEAGCVSFEESSAMLNSSIHDLAASLRGAVTSSSPPIEEVGGVGAQNDDPSLGDKARAEVASVDGGFEECAPAELSPVHEGGEEDTEGPPQSPSGISPQMKVDRWIDCCTCQDRAPGEVVSQELLRMATRIQGSQCASPAGGTMKVSSSSESVGRDGGFKALKACLGDLLQGLNKLHPQLNGCWDQATSLSNRIAFVLANFAGLALDAKERASLKAPVASIASYVAAFCQDKRSKIWPLAVKDVFVLAEMCEGRTAALDITAPLFAVVAKGLWARLKAETKVESKTELRACLVKIAASAGSMEVVQALTSREVSTKHTKGQPELHLELLCQAVSAATARDPAVSRVNRVSPETAQKLATTVGEVLKAGKGSKTLQWHAAMLFKALWAHAEGNHHIDRKGLLKHAGGALKAFLETEQWE
ncbi:hypothetical protein CYMTET_51361 [Cymbomonas tetramitiformis]|uniref:Uncharacterized protein n=1 Tax=Cymbomonas tetramitiformis TaxID=36881 RepID=A0AAE0BMQ1_9CHLO|nr:hypothetical protein CYMTET_51361 [Cymbomonas tetramitiformis]